jgi:formamidopyrimidine-DNA glycosylase
MPELPEVEEVRRSLEPHLLNIPIAAIRILRRDFITPKSAPLGNLVGQRITRTHRHGKNLFLTADDQQTLHLHLGMTGHVDCLPAGTPVAKHTHFILELANRTHIRFHDPRRFGGIWYYATLEKALAAQTCDLGPDALELTPQHLAHWRTARGGNGRLKQRLLTQHDVAGLGNIYVDEALWEAQLHPLQLVRRIAPAQIDKLVAIIRQLLLRSIELGGTTLRDYRNVRNQPGQFATRLHAYGRAGQPCHRCQTTLRSAQIAARTTVFCPTCQKRR